MNDGDRSCPECMLDVLQTSHARTARYTVYMHDGRLTITSTNPHEMDESWPSSMRDAQWPSSHDPIHELSMLAGSC